MNFINLPKNRGPRKQEKPKEPSPCSDCGKVFGPNDTRYVFSDRSVLCEDCFGDYLTRRYPKDMAKSSSE